MAVSQTLIKKRDWRQSVKNKIKQAIDLMTLPFTVLDMYPRREAVDPETGAITDTVMIHPHQAALHEHTTPSGLQPTFILMNGGVGCTGGDTRLNGVPMGDLAHNGVVSTLHGTSTSSQVYRKGQAALWKVTLRSGRSIVVTAHHRFLGLSGWRRLEDLAVGDLIAADGSDRDNFDWGRPKGYQHRYCPYLHPCDEVPSPEEVSLRSQQYTSCVPDTYLHDMRPYSSIGHSPHHTLHPEGAYLPLGGSAAVELLRGQLNTFLQSEQSIYLTHTERLCLASAVCLDGYSHERMLYRILSACLSLSEWTLEALVPLLLPFLGGEMLQAHSQGLDQSSLALYLPPTHNDTAFWDEIQDIQYDSFGDFFDLSVPGAENYSAEGIFNHNSGKTTSTVVELIFLARRYPGIIIDTIGPYDYFFDQTLWPAIREVVGDEDDCPFVDRVLTKNREWHFTNGSVWRFRAYDDPAKIKGWQTHILHFFEASEIGDGNNQKAKGIFDAALMRWRAPGPYPHRMYIEQNPKGHNWTWSLFVKDSPMRNSPINHWVEEPTATSPGKLWQEWERIGKDGSVWYTISSSTTMNKSLPVGYAEIMSESLSDEAKKRFIMGGFDPINELIYEIPNYSRATHTVSLIDVLSAYEMEYSDYDGIPAWWPVIVGIDVGGKKSPWAVECYFETPNKELICFAEFYKADQQWQEVSDWIKDTTQRFEQVVYYVDPISSKQHSGPTLVTVEDEFAEYGLTVDTPKGYNKFGGIAHVRGLLRPNRKEPCPFLQDYFNEELEMWEIGRARIYYIEGACKNNQNEKDVWRYDTKKQPLAKEEEEGLEEAPQEKPVDRNDHAQTAEMFATLGWWPREATPNRRKLRDRVSPLQTYGKNKRRAG